MLGKFIFYCSDENQRQHKGNLGKGITFYEFRMFMNLECSGKETQIGRETKYRDNAKSDQTKYKEINPTSLRF